MKKTETESAIAAAVQSLPEAADAQPEQPDAQGEFEALTRALAELIEGGAMPEGFDLESACTDASFAALLTELPPSAAVRVYAAEQRAAHAEQRAREEWLQQMQRRSGLPRAMHGAGAAEIVRDYDGMSAEEFRALEQQYRRAAQRGIRVRL